MQCLPACKLGGDGVQCKPAFCRRCRPEEFAREKAKAKPIMAGWAAGIEYAPGSEPNTIKCAKCGADKVRQSDGFCIGCGAVAPFKYITYLEAAGRLLSSGEAWQKRPRKAAKPVAPPPEPVRQVTLGIDIGPKIEKPKRGKHAR